MPGLLCCSKFLCVEINFPAHVVFECLGDSIGFLAEVDGNMMLELYNNSEAKVPDYKSMNPLALHIAFHVNDVAAVRRQLVAAGATPFNEIAQTDAGDVLTILRDPWGVPIQFLTRAKPMLK